MFKPTSNLVKIKLPNKEAAKKKGGGGKALVIKKEKRTFKFWLKFRLPLSSRGGVRP